MPPSLWGKLYALAMHSFRVHAPNSLGEAD
jgi:hypothetical protein